jgi:predicted amidohydrolase
MRVALDQWRPVTGGKAEGLARLDRSAAAARAKGAALLVVPEMALTGYNIGAAPVRAAAEPPGGPTARAVAAIARRHGLALVAGLPEAAGGNVYNAALMVGADGTPLASCRKTHLFGAVDRAQFAPGDALSPVFAYRGWRLALAICYDVEFPELVRSLALAGAEALLVPTANMEPYTGIARRVVPARAEENEIFLAYANYVGTEGAFDYCGLSCLVGPDGEDLARAGKDEEMILADLDRARLAAVRATISHLDDRRPGLYGRLADQEER